VDKELEDVAPSNLPTLRIKEVGLAKSLDGSVDSRGGQTKRCPNLDKGPRLPGEDVQLQYDEDILGTKGLD